MAEVEEQVVGFSNFGASRDPDATESDGEIYAIYLLADYWGQGIGREMMQASLQSLAEQSFRRTILWVLQEVTSARSIFYTAAGFSLDGEAKDEQWGDFTLHEVRMVR